MQLLTAIAIGVMFGIGVFQLLRRNIIRAALGFIILSNAVNLFLLSMGAYERRAPLTLPPPASAVMRCRRRWC